MRELFLCGSSVLGMGGYSRESVAVVRAKPEPFLYEPQKRFGTPASFNRAWTKHWCRADGFATRRRPRRPTCSVPRFGVLARKTDEHGAREYRR